MARLGCAVLALFLSLASCDAFCGEGVSWFPQLADRDAEFDVIVAQAPLFSTNKWIGKKMSLFGMYHTALIFAQKSTLGYSSHWTLEFDAVDGVFDAVLPQIVDGNITWKNDARFCLTQGLLWGRLHWTKTYSVAATLSLKQVDAIFTDVVLPYNGTGPGTLPHYQLWRMQPAIADYYVRDTTCADGVAWILHYIATHLNVKPGPGLLHFRSSSVVPRSYKLRPINASETEIWASMVKYYERQIELVRGVSVDGEHASALTRLVDAFSEVPMKYVYDAGTAKYYEIFVGRLLIFPFFRFTFNDKSMASPPFDPETPSVV